MLYSILFKSDYLLFSKKSVHLQCVFHSIRFKVNKRLEQGVAPFLFYPPYFYDKTSISFNPETSTYLQSFSTESLRQDNQVEIYEGNADVIYVPIEPMN